ncbi:MAG: rod shape-determining protein MreD [Deltaproteobacteria bacterium]
MMFYFMTPFCSFLVVLLQESLSFNLFFCRVFVEISLLFVLYATLHWDIKQSLVMGFCLGICMDWLVAPFYGLYLLSYMIIIVGAKMWLIPILHKDKLEMTFMIVMCMFVEMLLITVFYAEARSVGVLRLLFTTYVPQTVILCLIASRFFGVIKWLEGKLVGVQR